MCASIDVCIYENAQVVPVCVCILCICSNVWMNARVIHVYILLSMGAKEKTRWSVHVYMTMRMSFPNVVYFSVCVHVFEGTNCHV